MSLRTRLVLAVLAVLVLALAATDVAVREELRSSLFRQSDSALATASRSIRQVLVPHEHAGPSAPPGPSTQSRSTQGRSTQSRSTQGRSSDVDDRPPSFCDSVEYNAAPGDFVEVRSAGGAALAGKLCPARVQGRSRSPALPRRIRGVPPATSDQGGRGIFFVAASTAPGGPSFEVEASALSDDAPGRLLIVAQPLGSLQATLDQLLSIELVVSGAALVIGALLGWLLVHLDLRPLREIERTAGAIAGGDHESRVPGAARRSEVGHLASALNMMLSRIEQAFAERDATEEQLRSSEERLRRFVAAASHELRTPLSAVSAYAELFERGGASHPEDLERAMGGIRSETARMSRLVEDLLLLARLDEGRRLDLRPLELIGLATEAIETARAVDPRWPVRLVASEPVECLADPLRLRQVVDNLLSNVRSHTPPGTETAVAVRREEDEAVIEVADRGPGMAPEQRWRIFDRFYRADPSRARSRGGAGLGLSIVASIVAAHGGRVEVESAPGAGSTFRVRLPFHLDPSFVAAGLDPPERVVRRTEGPDASKGA